MSLSWTDWKRVRSVDGTIIPGEEDILVRSMAESLINRMYCDYNQKYFIGNPLRQDDEFYENITLLRTFNFKFEESDYTFREYQSRI